MLSLRARLSIAFIGIAVLTTVLTAAIASYTAHQLFRQYVERPPEGVFRPGDPDRIVIRTGAGPVRGRPFGIRERLFASRIRNAIWGGTLAAAGVGVLVALWLANRIVRPVAELTQATRAVAAGQPAPLVVVRGRDEIAELGETFNRMAVRLAQDEEQRRRLFAGIAHELRTPLSVIQGTLEGIMDHVIEPTSERIAAVHGQTVLLNRLITDLRDLTLAQAGQLQLHRRATDFAGVVRETVESLTPLFDERAVAVHLALPDALPAVQADPDRLRQIVLNVVENALRHTPAGGEVRIALEGNGSGVRFIVADTGTGIGADDLPHIFDHFYRADTSRTRSSGGTGLGLAIVKSLVEAHGGSVTVASEPGAGSTFTVALPSHP